MKTMRKPKISFSRGKWRVYANSGMWTGDVVRAMDFAFELNSRGSK
jgi:hypothetical protein